MRGLDGAEGAANGTVLVVQEVVEARLARAALNLVLAVDKDELPVQALPDAVRYGSAQHLLPPRVVVEPVQRRIPNIGTAVCEQDVCEDDRRVDVDEERGHLIERVEDKRVAPSDDGRSEGA